MDDARRQERDDLLAATRDGRRMLTPVKWYDNRRLQGVVILLVWTFIACWTIWGPTP